MLPIGPEFEPERNLPPFYLSADPPVATIVREPERQFVVTVEDPNRLDNLHFRWLIDYPPFDGNISRLALPDAVGAKGPDLPNQHTLRFRPSCDHLISPTLTQHQLLLVVTDRPFKDDSLDPLTGERILDATQPGAHRLSLSWTFEKECQ